MTSPDSRRRSLIRAIELLVLFVIILLPWMPRLYSWFSERSVETVSTVDAEPSGWSIATRVLFPFLAKEVSLDHAHGVTSASEDEA